MRPFCRPDERPEARDHAPPRPLARPKRSLALVALGALLGALAACGSDGGVQPSRSAPLPLGEGTAKAYTEAYLAEHPEALLRPEHLVVIQLEAVHDGHADADGQAGVDVLSYRVAAPLTVTLSIHENATLLSHLRLRHDSGVQLVRHVRGEDAVTVTLSPGTHHLELHHAQAGQASAPRQTIFFRLADAPQHVAVGSATRLAQRADQAGDVLAAGVASTTCIGCDFSNSWLNLHDFTSATLDRSNFYNALLDGTIFASAHCEGCDFSSSPQGTGRNADFTNAWLVSARFDNNFFEASKFNGANLAFASLREARFMSCDFSSVPGGNVTRLQHADLSGAGFFFGTFFENADLTGARVPEASFELQPLTPRFAGPVLRGAILANMTPADFFAGQNFAGVDISGIRWAAMDLSHVDLSQAVMSTPSDFSSAILSDGRSGVNLAGSKFPSRYAAFAGADMRFVDLSGASLYEADLRGANLSGAQLVGTNLSYANLAGAKLIGAQAGVAPGHSTAATQLFGAYLPNADLTDADLRSANLAGAHLYGDQALLVRTRLDSANLDHALLAGAAFDSTSLNDTSFDSAVLVNARFDNAILTNTRFANAYLQGAAFGAAAAIQGVSLNNAAVAVAAGSWSFTEQDGTPFTYGYGPSGLGLIATSASAGVTCPSSEFGPCTAGKLTPISNGPYPPQPACVPKGPRYCNCTKPSPPS